LKTVVNFTVHGEPVEPLAESPSTGSANIKYLGSQILSKILYI
jgi:hypothetical protein